jgi:hypothetical protein
MMEAVCFSEISVEVYQITRHYIPQDSTLYSHPVRAPENKYRFSFLGWDETKFTWNVGH